MYNMAMRISNIFDSTRLDSNQFTVTRVCYCSIRFLQEEFKLMS